MYPRNKTTSSVNLDDFSSVFLQANSNEQVSAMQMLNEGTARPVLNNLINDQSLNENRNLSNIISHIRDEGSARLQTKKTGHRSIRNKQRTPAVPVERTTPTQQKNTQPATVINEDVYMPDLRTSEENIQVKKGQWLPLVLSLGLAVTAVMGFNLYQLNEQTNEMKAALSEYEEQIDELTDNQQQSSDALIKVSKINEDLTGLKQELQAIKSDYTEFGNKLSQSNLNVPELQDKEIATVKQEVSDLENNLVSTLIEVTAIKEAMHEVKQAMVAKRDVEKTVTTKKEPVATGDWVVNLASFSTKEQALAGISMLEKSDIVPVVQEAKVNGTTVYRLIVDGFSTRNEAMLFVSEAKKQYGFEGGWVWQA